MFNIFGLAFNHSGVKRLEKLTNVLSHPEIYSYILVFVFNILWKECKHSPAKI